MGFTAAIGAMFASSMAMQGYSMASKPDMPKTPDAPKLDPQANENAAQKAAEKRRRMYQGTGRSSTILTDPAKLGGLSDQSQTPKQLLGL